MTYIIAIGMFQAMIALALLLTNKLKCKADSLLMLLLVCIGTHLAIKFAIFNLVQDDSVRYQMNTFIGFCYGPIVLLYARKIRDEDFVPIRMWYLFIPFLMAMVAYLTVISTLNVSASIGHQILELYNKVTSYALPVFNICFSVLAFNASKRITAALRREARLIYKMALCLSLVSLIGIAFAPFAAGLGAQGNLMIRSACYFLLSWICVFILRYKYHTAAHSQKGVADEQPALPDPVLLPPVAAPEIAETLSPEPAAPESIRKTQLTRAEHQAILTRLESYLARTKAYADTELSLDKLAAAISVNRYGLSETLNHYAGKSFYQYINEWRIRQVTEQIHDLAEKEIPINFLILAYDNGFKAKSSFNAYFKKIMGCTPSGYLKGLIEPAV